MQKQTEDTVARPTPYILYFFVVAMLIVPAVCWLLHSTQGIEGRRGQPAPDAQEPAAIPTLNPVDLNDIASCGRTAVVVGDDGAIAVSNNGAQSWKNVELASDDHLLTVAFSTDCSHAVAAGGGGTLLESSDGGNSWTAAPNGTNNEIRSVAINEDGNTRVAVGDGGLFIASINGERWNEVRGLGRGDGNSVALSESGQETIVTSGRNPVRIFKKDREGHFVLQSEYSEDGQRFMASIVESGTSFSALAVGSVDRERAILTYTDRDRDKWTSLQGNQERYLLLDIAAREGKFLAVGRKGIQVASIDGREWSSHRVQRGSYNLNSVAMNGHATAAVTVGESGTVLFALTDSDWWAGKFRERWEWARIDLLTKSEFTGVTFVSESEFVVVGERGTVQGDDSRTTSLYLCDLPNHMNSATRSHDDACTLINGIGKMVEKKALGR